MGILGRQSLKRPRPEVIVVIIKIGVAENFEHPKNISKVIKKESHQANQNKNMK